MPDTEEPPLRSETDTEAEEEEADPEPTAAPARPPVPKFKPATMVLTFLFLLGILMVFDQTTRNGVATVFAIVLTPILGFGGHYILLTMFLAAALEMALTAVAYNYTTDWIKAARVQKWSAAFRKVQMEALRAGKKDRVEALKPHQQTLTKLSSEMSIAQLKGMAVTWFLVIAIYTWVGTYVGCSVGSNKLVQGVTCTLSPMVNLGGTTVSLLGTTLVPLWFLIFSLYTIPSSLALRRLLKHYSLRKHAQKAAAQQAAGATAARGGA